MQLLRKPLFFVVLILLCCIALAFSNYFFHPNAFLLTHNGDGFKNYFTLAWNVAYDTGTHFSGMLYPYGDNLIYADVQPILSWSIKLLSIFFPGIINQTVGIMHICIFTSIILCGVFLYLIINTYIANKWVSAIAAIGITLLSPQMERLIGHFALSYVCVIPIIWYLHLRLIESEKKLQFALWLIFAITFFCFVHLYFLLTALLFIFSFIIIQIIRRKIQLKLLLLQIVVMAVPCIIVMLFMQLSDTVIDRPDVPYGFTNYRTTLGSLLAPDHGRAFAFWINNIGLPQADFEGYAYIGLFAVVAICITIIFLVSKIPAAIKNTAFSLPVSTSIFNYLFAAIVVLCFALGLPFIWGFDEWIEKIPIIRQFRSPGRFAWIFYYVINVYAIYVFYNLYLHLKRKHFRIAIIVLFVGMFTLIFESSSYFFNEAKFYNTQPLANPFNNSLPQDSDLTIGEINTDEYQAILFIPLFMQGSEKLYIDHSNGDFATAMGIAYRKGLPLMDAMMSRTSLSQSIAITSLVSNPLLEKHLPEHLNEKPILLITNHIQLSAADNNLIAQADSIAAWKNFTFYKLPVTAFKDLKKEAVLHFDSLQNRMQTDSLQNYFSELPLQIFYRNEFENLHAEKMYSGKGALQHTTGGFYLDEIVLDKHPAFWIEISFWTPAVNSGNLYPAMHLEFKDEYENTIAIHGINPKESSDIEHGWIRAARDLEVMAECKSIQIFIEEYPDILIDAVLIRHTAADVYYKNQEGKLIMNNYTIGK